MKTTLPYCKTSIAIKGYENSSIAKSEYNDCVVRAIASSFDVGYDESHEFVKRFFNRRNRMGTKNFVSKMYTLAQNNTDVFGKKLSVVGNVLENGRTTLKYKVKVKDKIVERRMTTSSFIKKNPVGSYIVVVRGHAFTIKDGVVIGNVDDSEKRKKIINFAWEVN